MSKCLSSECMTTLVCIHGYGAREQEDGYEHDHLDQVDGDKHM